jgi:O-antigen ligase/tetratricopeptide (TPR) repeat protein
VTAAPAGTARVLGWSLAAFLALAPLPFASVHAGGRAAFEWGAFALLAAWLARSVVRTTPLPPRSACVGLVGLALFAWVQALPLGPVADLLVPGTALERAALSAPTAVLEAERNVLGVDPSRFDRAASLSVDAPVSASAARTASAYAAIGLVGFTVAALGGIRRIALGLLAGGAFQALYGILVLASGHGQIWNVPKTAYLDSATGTFVNRNHYAAYLALALAVGTGLLLSRFAGSRSSARELPPWLRWTEARSARTALLATGVVLVAAGLLVSFSRAGISVGIAALAVTLFASRVPSRGGLRAALLIAMVAVAALPLLSLGAGPLASRFASAQRDFLAPGGRAMVWGDTLRLAASHPIVGSGLGTFAEAYPPYRSPSVRSHYTHAHNDWLQAAAEGGLVGGVLLLSLLVPVTARWLPALAGRHGPLLAGCAAGLGAFAAHALIDFPARIPAVTAAALAVGAAILAVGRSPREVPRSSLRIVTPDSRRRLPRGRHALALAAPLILISATAGMLGAGDARSNGSPWEASARAAEAALRAGPEDDLVDETLRTLRRALGARPFHAETRAAYAAVLLEATFGTHDAVAAAFHARAAADSSPVSRPVVEVSADVLLRSGDARGAMEWILAMFAWDPTEAARMLGRAEPLLEAAGVDVVLPDDPTAWEAWSARLARSGRKAEARGRRLEALARWPGNAFTRVALAEDLLRSGEIDRFLEVVPPDLEIEERRDHAALLVHRARSRGLSGDSDGARADALSATRVGKNEPGILLRAADALVAVEQDRLARELWVRALHRFRSAGNVPATVATLSRIARLDEKQGRHGDAYRAWREVLTLDPDHGEASRRVERLTGSAP